MKEKKRKEKKRTRKEGTGMDTMEWLCMFLGKDKETEVQKRDTDILLS